MARERVDIIIRAKDLASRVFSGVGGGLKKIRVSAMGLRRAFVAVAASAAGVIFAFKKMFDAGSGVLETQSKFNTVFAESAEEMNTFTEVFSRLAGITKVAGKEIVATAGAIAQGMGLSHQASVDFSKAIFKLAGDLASFNNIPVEDAANAVTSAITGEREQLKRLGVVIRQVDIDQQAMVISGKKNVSELNNAERAAATLQIITKRAGVAIGDLVRTQDSSANSARRVKAAFVDQFNQLSTDLIPVLQTLLPMFQQLADKAAAATERVAGFITILFDMAGLTSSTLRKSLEAFELLPENQRELNLKQREETIATNRATIGRLGTVTGLSAGQIGTQLKERKALEEETNQLQIALDILQTRMARLRDTAGGTADSVEDVVRSFRQIAAGAPGAPEHGLGAPGLAAFGADFLGGAAGGRDRLRMGRNAITGGNQFLNQVLNKQLQKRQEELAASSAAAAVEVDRLGTSVVTNFSQMAAAAISGSQQMEQVVISAFTNILSSLKGISPFGGAIIGAVGGVFGSLFGGGRREPIPVNVKDVTGNAFDKLQSFRTVPDVQITIVDPRRNVREVLAELSDLEARDGVARFPASLGGSG